MQPLTKELESWLKEFSNAVRSRDFTSGRNLFDCGVVSFGTACSRAEGLNELVARQWQAVWPVTKEFEFEYESALAWTDAAQAVVVAGWKSTGLGNDGACFPRRGRATIILRRAPSEWRAVHTHFSLEPSLRHDPLPHQQLLAAR